MTVSVLTGLVLQFLAAVIVHVAIRGDWLRRPAALMLLMAILGHGITEVMQWIWPGRNAYFRDYVSQAALDNWIRLVSVAILSYAVAYVLVLRIRRRDAGTAGGESSAHISRLRLGWLLLLAAPLLLATFQGRGALQPVAPGQTASRENYALVGLAGQFLVPLLAVIGAVVLVRYGSRWMLPLFVVQGALLSMAGSRSMIVTACLLSLFGARLCGVRLSRRQVAWVVVVVAFFTVLISSTRSVAGRETFTQGIGAERRIDGLVDGVAALPTAESREAVLNDVVYRFDTNTFGTLVLESLSRHTPPVGLETTRNNLLIVVPSFLDPDKLSRTVESRSEESFLDRRFGLDQRVDWLPGIFGAMLGYFGALGLPVLALLFGAAMGVAERFALRRASTARFLLGVGLAQCALLYSAGPQALFVTMRGVLFFVLLLWVAAALRRGYVAVRFPAGPVGTSRMKTSKETKNVKVAP
ncbi:hypothetical protein [Plantactinospora sp. BB1]|uniref:hypothetical protein n=1 Tax=Plantactinospora sp. BB1 TaxID=2071627 RepID=UPI000D171F16|nr:hypothetical protein [Plantactinospora sp. BB1]AVT36138.1 hypothetical protein C6W10_06290 [Plantactinospora sp. BB1]